MTIILDCLKINKLQNAAEDEERKKIQEEATVQNIKDEEAQIQAHHQCVMHQLASEKEKHLSDLDATWRLKVQFALHSMMNI